MCGREEYLELGLGGLGECKVRPRGFSSAPPVPPEAPVPLAFPDTSEPAEAPEPPDASEPAEAPEPPEPPEAPERER